VLAPAILATVLQLVAPVSLRDAAARPLHLLDKTETLHFEPNVGQAREDAAFITRGRGYVASLTPQHASFRFRSHGVVGMRFLGANPRATLAGQDALAGRSHYFRGGEPGAWVTNVPNYRRIIGRDLYPGIDVV
jgi:hypothetical protein